MAATPSLPTPTPPLPHSLAHKPTSKGRFALFQCKPCCIKTHPQQKPSACPLPPSPPLPRTPPPVPQGAGRAAKCTVGVNKKPANPIRAQNPSLTKDCCRKCCRRHVRTPAAHKRTSQELAAPPPPLRPSRRAAPQAPSAGAASAAASPQLRSCAARPRCPAAAALLPAAPRTGLLLLGPLSRPL